MTAVSSRRCVAVLLASLALLTGVMGEGVDTDLVGIVVAAVCIAILFIVLCSFLAFCCYRGMDLERHWVVGRKDSGSVTPPSSRPAYKVATDPVMYALPCSARGDVFLQRHSKLRHSDRPAETAVGMRTTSQSNGHVVQDLPSSGFTYRAIHTQDVAVGTTPLWLNKSYVETEKSLEIQDDDDDDDDQPINNTKPTSPPPSPTKQPGPPTHPPQPPQPHPKPHVQLQAQRSSGHGWRAVRAEVSPKHSQLDSREVLHVSEEFTIIDFVDPRQLRQQQQQRQQQPQQETLGPPAYSYRAYLDHDFHHTTAITRYCVPKKHIADTSHGSSGSGFVPPVSTSTPRSPTDEDPAKQETDHPRMRNPKEGSVKTMPAKSVGYKGDFQL